MRRVSGGPVVPDIRAVWQANTVFSPGDVFTYNGGVYEVTATYTSGGSFGATDLANTTAWEAQSGTYVSLAAATAEGASTILASETVGPNHPPFRWVIDNTVSATGSAQTFYDPVMFLGWNYGPAASRVDSSKPAIGLAFEEDFWTNTGFDGAWHHQTEAHLQHIGVTGAARRIFSSAVDWRDDRVDLSFRADWMTANDATGRVFSYSPASVDDTFYLSRSQVACGYVTGAYVVIGSLGTGNAWVDARGAGADVGLELRAKGAGEIELLSNSSISDGKNVRLGTGTGTKIGTAQTQKLGFFGATPVVQPTATPAAATDLTTVIALTNSLRTSLLALGLVA